MTFSCRLVPVGRRGAMVRRRGCGAATGRQQRFASSLLRRRGPSLLRRVAPELRSAGQASGVGHLPKRIGTGADLGSANGERGPKPPRRKIVGYPPVVR